ncbi:MAG TPA: HlyD family secretion protein [Gemmatimonadales bacterium]|jgi:membrane fusion protein (multidrug efflux system)|nr:HlyD family secretion protein [Gemmatimonadales bacterium]
MTATTTPETAPAAPRNRRPLLILGTVATLILAWGLAKYIHGRTHVETDNAQVDGHITPISPKVQAFVAEVRVDDNQPVKAGDTLIVLDDRDLRVRLAQAEADLAAARAAAGSQSRAGLAVAQLEASKAQAGATESAVASAEAAFRKADADLARMRTLAAQQIVAQSQLDAAQAAYDGAKANLDAARRTASAADNNVLAAQAALTGADARLAAAQAAVDNARLQLTYTRILAPVDGIIAKRSLEAGALVSPGQQVMAVVPTHGVWVTANLKETELEGVTPGDPAEIRVDAYPGKVFHGAVESVSPATGARFALIPPDNATGNFTKVVQRVPVRIAITDTATATMPLRPGMSVVVEITTR